MFDYLHFGGKEVGSKFQAVSLQRRAPKTLASTPLLRGSRWPSSLPQWNNPAMIVGERLRVLREEKKLSQGDVEKRTGLLRCYISRVENGHTVPNIETLEKMARAYEVPLYHLLYEGEEPP
jgi:ribosome-binding protein aMBF1 (putative translation factor)